MNKWHGTALASLGCFTAIQLMLLELGAAPLYYWLAVVIGLLHIFSLIRAGEEQNVLDENIALVNAVKAEYEAALDKARETCQQLESAIAIAEGTAWNQST